MDDGASTSARGAQGHAAGLYAYHPAAAHHHQQQQHSMQQHFYPQHEQQQQPYGLATYQPDEQPIPPPSAGGTDGGSFDDDSGGAQADEPEARSSSSRRPKSSGARFGVACLKWCVFARRASCRARMAEAADAAPPPLSRRSRSRKVKCDGQVRVSCAFFGGGSS
jgi:hypothetical protein